MREAVAADDGGVVVAGAVTTDDVGSKWIDYVINRDPGELGDLREVHWAI